jgi:multimeric flavodoxin WrbA
MKNLLGIVASPRKLGNSEIFIKELYGQLRGVWELKLIRLPELNIRPCQACYRCLFEEMRCVQNDDLSLVLEAFTQSDAYVVAAPTYFLGANATLKLLLDRGLSFYAYFDKLWGKPAVGVAIAGNRGMEGYTKLIIESFIKLTLGDLRGSAVVYGALPGEILVGNEGKETARQLAEALVHGRGSEFDAPTCPLCGSDTFRFLPHGQVRCMLCSNSGDYRWEENGVRCYITSGEHHLFLGYENAKKHPDLLRAMKGDFLARRKELKAMIQQYDQVGTWIQVKKNKDRE